jgi:hypothetical protein
VLYWQQKQAHRQLPALALGNISPDKKFSCARLLTCQHNQLAAVLIAETMLSLSTKDVRRNLGDVLVALLVTVHWACC